ncbi:hypothetical protein BDW42DRAFT_187298 [Aspergillus taichungensis]|uniref:Uncharacterized protein n=1 Tax=Aspergillus taichungensis TaxID=482145 RepID=A0A2J5HN44_9EURO|nr:hypothetical protein BDW42DRAFT_187298 [Aspergillus taichungensis]
MPRRSSRPVPVSAAPLPTPKRRASGRHAAASQSRRRAHADPDSPDDEPVRSTTKKSRYFQSKTDVSSNPSDSDSSLSATEEPEFSTPSDEASEQESTDDEAATRPPSKRAKRGEQGQSQGRSQGRGRVADGNDNDRDKELWREGVSTGLGPGKEVFIQKPRARSPGSIPYQETTLHPNTFRFLQDLATNNERAWLKAHDPDFRTAKKDWEDFVLSFTDKIEEVDGTIPPLPAKDLVFRIHRDIRFSKNPTPYKTHFSAAWSRTGKKGPYAAYYVHCQPGSCFVGSGLWHPEADKLALLRDEVNANSDRLKSILKQEGLRREFLKGVPDDEDQVVDAFCNQNKEGALKTKPKGYDLDNENIQLLRLRSFTIGKPLSDEDLQSTGAQDRIAVLIGIMEPFVTYLNSVVMPDTVGLDISSESESDG